MRPSWREWVLLLWSWGLNLVPGPFFSGSFPFSQLPGHHEVRSHLSSHASTVMSLPWSQKTVIIVFSQVFVQSDKKLINTTGIHHRGNTTPLLPQMPIDVPSFHFFACQGRALPRSEAWLCILNFCLWTDSKRQIACHSMSFPLSCLFCQENGLVHDPRNV